MPIAGYPDQYPAREYAMNVQVCGYLNQDSVSGAGNCDEYLVSRRPVTRSDGSSARLLAWSCPWIGGRSTTPWSPPAGLGLSRTPSRSRPGATTSTERAAGAARPQATVAEVRGVNQQNVSRAVARGDEVVGEPERLAYALTLARAAGVELGLVGTLRAGDTGKP